MNFKQKVLKDLVSFRINAISKISTKRAAALAFDLFCTPVSNPNLPTPAIFQLAKTFQYKSGNEIIHGYRWNEGKPIKILIVHGFSSSPKKFDHLIQPLVEVGYEVTCLDAPAHGSSSGRRINALTYTQSLKDFFEIFGTVSGIIAHSLGGLATILAIKDLPNNDKIKTVLFAPATESTTQLDLFTQYLKISPSVKTQMLMLIKEISKVSLEDISISKNIQYINGPVYWFHDEMDPITPYLEAKMVAEAGAEKIEFYSSSGLGHSGIYKEIKNCKKVLEIFDFKPVISS